MKKDLVVWRPPKVNKHTKVVIVFGSRTITDRKTVWAALDQATRNFMKCVVLTGGAKGVDQLAEAWAHKNWYTTLTFFPDYERYPGKVAPVKRNREMAKAAVQMAKKVYAIGFWDGESRGTKDMIEVCKDFGFNLKVLQYG